MDMERLQQSGYVSTRFLTPRDIATPIFRHRRFVLRTFAILATVTVLAVILRPKTYRAEMEILVKHARVDAAVSSGRDNTLANPQEVTEGELNSEVALIKSRDLLEKVVRTCNLQDSHLHPLTHLLSGLWPSKRNEEATAAENVSQAVSDLESKLSVEPIKKTNLIQITYDSTNPELAAYVLNTLGNLYLEKTVAVHSAPGAFAFFQAESQRYGQALHAAERQLADFDRHNGVADPEIEKQVTIQKSAEFQANFGSTVVAIKEAEKRIHAVEQQLVNTPEQTASQVRTASNPYLLNQLKTTLLNLQLKRSELLQKFEPEYPPVQQIENQINVTTEAIKQAENSPTVDETKDRNPSYEWLRSELTRSTAELPTLQARAAETQKVIGRYKAQLGEIAVNGTTQRDLVRQIKEAEGNYVLYVQRREEARIGEALDNKRIVNVAIAEAATIPAFPTDRYRALTLLFGVALAGLIAPGLAFVLDRFDSSVRTPAELQIDLQTTVLVTLPQVQGKSHVS